MRSKKNYRKFYEEIIGYKIPKGFDIHHLDYDNNNNKFDNLLMLPKKLHNKFHKLLPLIKGTKLSIKITSHLEPGSLYNSYTFDNMKKFVKVHSECCKWKDYKEYQLGNLPNIHKINL